MAINTDTVVSRYAFTLFLPKDCKKDSVDGNRDMPLDEDGDIKIYIAVQQIKGAPTHSYHPSLLSLRS